jgi:hypothetical protein
MCIVLISVNTAYMCKFKVYTICLSNIKPKIQVHVCLQFIPKNVGKVRSYGTVGIVRSYGTVGIVRSYGTVGIVRSYGTVGSQIL